MKQYVVDAFTDQIFKGNPAAVCVLDKNIPDELMKKITAENNLSETAFVLKKEDRYLLRWFTPGGEIDLCGHATLATAFVILNFYDKGSNKVQFDTFSGILTVTKRLNLYEMDFPAYDLSPIEITPQITEALGATPKEAYLGRDLLCVFEDKKTIQKLVPIQEKVKALDGLLLHVTAPADDVDCVSRTFAPKCEVDEDPVCGSGHCHIAPYWSKKLNKREIVAFQASDRGGKLYCRVEGDRVYLAGSAALFSIADIFLPQCFSR